MRIQGISVFQNCIKTVYYRKKSKKNPLSEKDKQNNRKLSSQRVSAEHVIGKLKIFKILSDRYRNRRRRFGLRFNLIAGIYNFELKLKRKKTFERGLMLRKQSL